MVAALALGVAACGDDDSTGSSDPTSAEDVKPAAQIDKLTGVDTAVTLDAGFVQALTKLKVTPGPVGDADLSKDGVASFPITGGNVIYYDPASPVRPYVQGMIDHEGSGLSLTAGKTEVELTDFVIDPGTSELTGTVSVNGKDAATDALLFDLDGSTLKPLQMRPRRHGDAGGHHRPALRRRSRPAERHVRHQRSQGRTGGRDLRHHRQGLARKATDVGGRGPFPPRPPALCVQARGFRNSASWRDWASRRPLRSQTSPCSSNRPSIDASVRNRTSARVSPGSGFAR